MVVFGLAFAVTIPPPASAQEYVQPTEIRFDLLSRLSRDRGVAFVIGTLTCDADGTLFNLEMRVDQGTEYGTTNEDMAGFPCTDEGSPFRVAVENEAYWRPGFARVVRIDYADLPTGQRLVLLP
jgi:hypothetical protein